MQIIPPQCTGFPTKYIVFLHKNHYPNSDPICNLSQKNIQLQVAGVAAANTRIRTTARKLLRIALKCWRPAMLATMKMRKARSVKNTRGTLWNRGLRACIDRETESAYTFKEKLE